jgi:hypothetical protein
MPTLYPENTQYFGDDTSKKLAGLQSSLFKQLQEKLANPTTSATPKAIPNPAGTYTSLSSSPSLNTKPEGALTAGSLGAPNSAKIFPASQLGGNIDYWKSSTAPGATWTGPSDTSNVNVRQWPEALGGGQYFIDPTQTDKIIRSSRTYDTAEQTMMQQGLPSYLFQIDHIIPKFLGGTDDPANKELLSIIDHENKTKIQAVANTLLSNGKITENQARLMAFNWKDKSPEGIPTPYSANDPEGIAGFIDLKTAEKIAKRWEEGPKATWKSVLKEIPETITSWGKKTPIIGPALAEGFRGLVKQGTLGFAPVGTAGEYENTADQTAATIGNIAGSTAGFIWGFGKFKAGWQAVKMGKQALMGMKALEAAEGAGVAAGIASKGVSLLGKLKMGGGTLKAASLVKAIPFVGEGGQIAVDGAQLAKMTRAFTTQKVLSDMGLLATYGQLNKQDAPGLENRMTRFMADVAFGGILGTAGQNLKGYARVGAGTMTISMISSAFSGAKPEDIIKDSILNAAITTSLHGMGYRGSKQAAAAQREAVDLAAKDAANRAAVEFLSPYSGGKLKVGEPIPKMTEKQALTLQKEAFENLDKLINLQKGWDPEDVSRARIGITVSTRQLYKNSLPKILSEKADIEDLLSIGQKVKNKESLRSSDPTTPKNLYDLADRVKLGELSIDASIPNEGKFPTGKIPITGIAEQISPTNKANLERFFDATQGKSGEKAERFVILTDRSDLRPLIEKQNSLISEAQIASMDKRPSQNPQNNVQAFGIVYDEAGNASALSLGWVPRKFTLNESKFNQNARVKSLNARYPDQPQLELFDPSYNKDAIAEGMKAQKTPFVVAKVEAFTRNATESKQPYLEVKISDAGWRKGQELMAKLNKGDTFRGLDDLTKNVNAVKKVSENISEARLKTALMAKEESTRVLDDIEKNLAKGILVPETQMTTIPTTEASLKEVSTPVVAAKITGIFRSGAISRPFTSAKTGYWKPEGNRWDFIPGLKEPGQPSIYMAKPKKASVQKVDIPTRKNMVDTVSKQMFQAGDDLLENYKVPKREMNRDAYTRYLKGVIDSVDVNIPKGMGFQDYQAARTKVQDRLRVKATQYVEEAFDPKNEIKFSDFETPIGENKRVHPIKALALEFEKEGLDPERAMVAAIKRDTEIKLGLKVAEKTPTTQKSFDPLAREGLQTLGIKAWHDNTIGHLKNTPKDNYSYGFAKTMDEGLKKAFGEKYSTNWSLNSYFDMTTNIGKMMWGPRNISGTLNENKMPISQFKQFSKAVESKNSQAIHQASVERNRALDLASQGRTPLGASEAEVEAAQSGLRLKDATQGEGINFTDMTKGELNIFKGRISAEADGNYSAERGADDANRLIWDIVNRYNSNPNVKTPAKRPYMAPILEEVKAEASTYRNENKAVAKTSKGILALGDKIASIVRSIKSMEKLDNEGKLSEKIKKQLSANRKLKEDLAKIQEMLKSRGG